MLPYNLKAQFFNVIGLPVAESVTCKVQLPPDFSPQSWVDMKVYFKVVEVLLGLLLLSKMLCVPLGETSFTVTSFKWP